VSMGTGQQYISAGNPAQFTYTITNNGPDPATGIVISANLSTSVTGIPMSNVSGSISSGTCGSGGSTNTGISCGPISLQSGSTATLTITATPQGNSSGTSQFFNGGTVQAIGPGNIVLAQTSVSAKMSDFKMAVSPSNQSIAVAGDTATYTVNLTPDPIYASSITVSCSGLPPASACPSKTVSLPNSSGASVVLNVTTTARPSTTGGIFTRHFYAIWLMIPGLVLVGLGRGRRRRQILGIFLLCATFAMLLLLPACSSSKTQTPPAGTPAGNYNITVTAASGSDSKTQTVTLNVP
jgi:uncharacterized repeat protein (TIGR01451 family)